MTQDIGLSWPSRAGGLRFLPGELASPIPYLRLPLQTVKVGSCGAAQKALGLAKWKRARLQLVSTSEV